MAHSHKLSRAEMDELKKAAHPPKKLCSEVEFKNKWLSDHVAVPLCKHQCRNLYDTLKDYSKRAETEGIVKFDIVDCHTGSPLTFNWMEAIMSLKHNSIIPNSNNLRINYSFREIRKLEAGAYFIRRVEPGQKNLKAFMSKTIGQLMLFYEELFGTKNLEPRDRLTKIMTVFQSLGSKKKYSPLIVPYITVTGNVNVDNDEERSGITWNEVCPILSKYVDKRTCQKAEWGGINQVESYFAFTGASFQTHGEDGSLTSLNLNITGFDKIWFVNRPCDVQQIKDELRKTMEEHAEFFNEHFDGFPILDDCFVQHKCILLFPSYFDDRNIQVKVFFQAESQLCYISSLALHGGINLGANYCKAVNACYDDFATFPHLYYECMHDEENHLVLKDIAIEFRKMAEKNKGNLPERVTCPVKQEIADENIRKRARVENVVAIPSSSSVVATVEQETAAEPYGSNLTRKMYPPLEKQKLAWKKAIDKDEKGNDVRKNARFVLLQDKKTEIWHFCCVYCGSGFDTEPEVKMHLATKHFICCPCGYMDINNLGKHKAQKKKRCIFYTDVEFRKRAIAIGWQDN